MACRASASSFNTSKAPGAALWALFAGGENVEADDGGAVAGGKQAAARSPIAVNDTAAMEAEYRGGHAAGRCARLGSK